jgi:hypothetical protein
VPLLFKRWQRRFPDAKFEYFLVWERTKRGWPHAHILLVAPRVAKRWLSAQWRELSGSFIVDIQPVNSNERAASYLAKYLAKDPAVPAGFRRWRRSRGFFNVAEEPRSEKLPRVSAWTIQPRSALAQALRWLESGFCIDLKDKDLLKCRDDPAGHARQVDSGMHTTLLLSLPPWERTGY